MARAVAGGAARRNLPSQAAAGRIVLGDRVRASALARVPGALLFKESSTGARLSKEVRQRWQRQSSGLASPVV